MPNEGLSGLCNERHRVTNSCIWQNLRELSRAQFWRCESWDWDRIWDPCYVHNCLNIKIFDLVLNMNSRSIIKIESRAFRRANIMRYQYQCSDRQCCSSCTGGCALDRAITSVLSCPSLAIPATRVMCTESIATTSMSAIHVAPFWISANEPSSLQLVIFVWFVWCRSITQSPQIWCRNLTLFVCS